MQKIIVSTGLIFAIIGIIVTVASIVPIEDTHVWLNETFVAPEFGYYTYWGSFAQNTALHITFTVSYGGDRSTLEMCGLIAHYLLSELIKGNIVK
ncbi:hypothetical protein KAS06_03435 [Candidatus Bathyarchaeota archaeon]|nr:hypothetical protein [Candidatus Bathyarchaeota archaeon]